MTASVEPQTPEEAAALRELAAKHRRRHRWIALLSSVVVSVHATLILHSIWRDWPLDARDLIVLGFFVVNALGSVGWLAWGLRGLREEEAIDRQWKLEDVRWRAQRQAWSQPWEERTRQQREGYARGCLRWRRRSARCVGSTVVPLFGTCRGLPMSRRKPRREGVMWASAGVLALMSRESIRGHS